MKVFVSYSRSEAAIADRLVDDLESRAFEVIIDRRDLPYGEEWQAELADFIRASDTVVWLASPTSVNSRWCNWELGEVQRISKRLIPVRVAPLTPEDLPEALGRIHVLPVEGVYDPVRHIDDLVRALETDREWIRTHTRLADRATEWLARGRLADRLLRGRALREAQAWRDRRPASAPSPGGETLELLNQSQRAATRRLRQLVGIVVAGLVLMTGLTASAVWQAAEARRQALIADEQRGVALAREIEAIAQRNTARSNEYRALVALGQVAASDGDATAALKLALAGWPRRGDETSPRFEAVLSVLSDATALPQEQGLIARDLPLLGMALSPDADRVISWAGDGKITVRSVETGAAVVPAMHHGSSIGGAVVNAAADRIASWSGNGTILLWDAGTGQQVGPPLKHQQLVNGGRFAADGSKLLTWSNDHTLRLWDGRTGAPLGPAMRHDQVVRGAVFNPDQTRILSWSDDHTLRFWEVARGAQIGPSLAESGTTGGAEFSRDGAHVLSWNEDTVRVWDSGGSLVATISHEDSPAIYGARFSPDGGRILTWSVDGTVRLWSATGGAPSGLPMDHHSLVNGAIFSVNGERILSWALDGTVRLWETATGDQIGTTMHHDKSVEGAAFNPDETEIASWSADETTKRWDASTGEQIGPALRGQAWINDASYSADGSLLLARAYDTVYLWNLGRNRPYGPVLHYPGAINSATYNADGRRLLLRTDGFDEPISLWDTNTGRRLGPAGAETYYAVSARFSDDGGRGLSVTDDGSGNGTIFVWDAADGKVIASIAQAEVAGARFSPDGKSVLGWSRDHSLHLWDVAGVEAIGPSMLHEGEVTGAVFSPDGALILSRSSDRTMRLWRADTGVLVGQTNPVDEDFVTALFSPDRGRAVGWSEHYIVILDSVSGMQVSEIARPEGLHGVSFNPDGRRLLAWSDHALWVYDAADGSLEGTVLPDLLGGSLSGAAFDPGGATVLTWSDEGTLARWDFAMGLQVGPSMHHESDVVGARFSTNGRVILSWSHDHSARLWDAASGIQIGAPMLNDDWVAWARFSRDDSRVLTGAKSGTISLWDASTGMQIGDAMPTGNIFGPGISPGGDRLLIWSDEQSARQWNISWPAGNIIQVACALIPKTDGKVDLSDVEARYGIKITEPICTPEQLAVPIDWSTIERMPAQ